MKLFEINARKSFGHDTIGRLERILRSKLGKLYRFGGDTGVFKDTQGDLGYLYFFGKRAFRLDYVRQAGRIAFIDVWNDAAEAVAGRPADAQIELPDGVSIFKLLSQVINLIKHPKLGDVEAQLDPNVRESVEELEDREFMLEAQRVTVDQFVSKAKEWASKHGKPDLVFTYMDLKAVSAEYDIQLPGGVYELGIGDRSAKTYDLSRIEQSQSGLIIRVHPAGQGHRFHFDTSAPLSRADQRELEQAIEPLSADELFDDLERLIKMVVKRARPSLMVIGGPGTGKTKTITDTIAASGQTKGTDWIMVKGKMAPLSLYSTLYLNNGKLIVFDDTDSVWDSDDSINILKAALDSSPVRLISWSSDRTQAVAHMTDEEKNEYNERVRDALKDDPSSKMKLPGEFEFTGRIIFISNKPKNELDSAVLNRSMFIDMSLTNDQVFARIEGIMDKLSSPNEFVADDDVKREVLEHLKSQSATGKLKYVSIRTFVGALGVAVSGDPEWRRLLKYMGSD